MLRLLMASLLFSSVSMQTVLAEGVWVRCSLNTKTKLRFWGKGERTISLGTSTSFKPLPKNQLDSRTDFQSDIQLGECLVPKHQLEDLTGLQSKLF